MLTTTQITVGIDEKKKDIEYPTRGGVDPDSTHHVPVNPTETSSDNGVLIMNSDERPTNFFAQPGILAGKFTIFFGNFMNISLFNLIHSCHRWSRCWIIVCNSCRDVHRVSNEKEGRRKLRTR